MDTVVSSQSATDRVRAMPMAASLDPTIIPVSAVVPTMDRPAALGRTLGSLSAQAVLPAELIVVDGSKGDESGKIVEEWGAIQPSIMKVICQRAEKLGAAAQRNQGVLSAMQPYVWFFDDDILFEPECVSRLWRAITSDPNLGGVNASIIE